MNEIFTHQNHFLKKCLATITVGLLCLFATGATMLAVRMVSGSWIPAILAGLFMLVFSIIMSWTELRIRFQEINND